MQRVLFILILVAFFCARSAFASVEKTDDNDLNEIARIEIGVKSCEVRIFESEDVNEYWSYPAATASPKNSSGLPYGREGVIHSIVLNPEYRPTPDTKKEAAKKHRKLKKYYPPNSSGNPLGKLKMYIGFLDANFKLYNSSLGIHTTTQQDSIGKRVSHGCVRQYDDDATEIATVIMKQDGYSDKQIADYFKKAQKNPHVPVKIPIRNGPKVVYMKK